MNLKYLFLIGMIVQAMISCKPEPCDKNPEVKYYSIPQTTLPYILNRKGETLIFANPSGDSIEFYCSDMVHQNVLIKQLYGGMSADCYKSYDDYGESYKFNYVGNSPVFKFLRVRYIVDGALIPDVYTNFNVNISDSVICENGLVEGIIKKVNSDSILLNGKYYSGFYFSSGGILFNKQIGIIKFIDKQNISWQLINKK